MMADCLQQSTGNAEERGAGEVAKDTQRMDWLAAHLHSADFEYPHADSHCVLIIEWPNNVAVGGSLRANVDAALAAVGKP